MVSAAFTTSGFCISKRAGKIAIARRAFGVAPEFQSTMFIPEISKSSPDEENRLSTKDRSWI